MAEGRMLKKQVSRSRRLAELKTDSARMLYTWIIPHLDIAGRFYADPSMVKGSVVPRIKDFNEEKINACLTDMENVGLIDIYEVDGDKYFHLKKFEDHQTLNPKREAPSKIPPPPKQYKRKCLLKSTWQVLWNNWERSDKKCPICGRVAEFVPGKGYFFDGCITTHIDHIIPVSRGGTSDIDNLRITCAKCNLSKGNSIDELEIQDDTLDNSGVTLDNSGVTPAKGKLREVKLSEVKADIAPSGAPSIEEENPIVIEIAEVADKLYKQKIFPKVVVFVNTCRKQKVLPETILHALKQCLTHRPRGDPWAYCAPIVGIEDGNFRERKARVEHESIKDFWKDWTEGPDRGPDYEGDPKVS